MDVSFLYFLWLSTVTRDSSLALFLVRHIIAQVVKINCKSIPINSCIINTHFYTKNLLFFILHTHFYKTPTSVDLFYHMFYLNNHFLTFLLIILSQTLSLHFQASLSPLTRLYSRVFSITTLYPNIFTPLYSKLSEISIQARSTAPRRTQIQARRE